MKKTLIATLVVASAVAFVGAASAADTSGFSGKGSGGYVGVNVGYADADWSTSQFSNVSSVKDNTGIAYGLDLGYMFNSNLGIEFAYDMYPDQKLDSGATQIGKVKSQSFPSISTVFNFPMAMQWDLFAKLGMAYLSPKIETTVTGDDVTTTSGASETYKVWAPQIAIGGAYDIMPNLSLDAQLKYIMQNKETGATITPNYTAFTVGVNYKF